MQEKITSNLVIVLFLAYLLSASGNSLYVTGDGIVRHHVLENLATTGNLDVPAEFSGGFAMRGTNGKYYDPHELGDVLVRLPFYWTGKRLGAPEFLLSLPGPLALALAGLLFFRLARLAGHNQRTALILTLLLGLCTQFLPESKSPFSHSLETLFCLAAFYQAYGFFLDGQAPRLGLAGLALACAFLVRTTSILMWIPILYFTVLRLRIEGDHYRIGRAVKLGILLLLSFAPLSSISLWYNHHRFGCIFTTGYARWAEFHQINNFGNPLWKGILGLLVSPGKGVFFYCPIVLLSICVGKRFWVRRKELSTAFTLLVVAYLLLLGKYTAWHGDCAWGPRYLTVLLPYLMLPLGVWIEDSLTSSWKRSVLLATAALSFLVQVAGICIDMNVFFYRARMAGMLGGPPERVTAEFPDSLYFSLVNSPLVARLYEISDAIRESRSWSEDSKSKQDLPQIDLPSFSQVNPQFDFWWSEALRQHKPLVLVPVSGLVLVLFCLSGRLLRACNQTTQGWRYLD